MKRKEFIKLVSEKNENGLSQKVTGDLVDSVFGALVDVLESDDDFVVQGFGKFYSTKNPEGTIKRNPKTGDKIDVSGRKQLKFKYSTALKEELK